MSAISGCKVFQMFGAICLLSFAVNSQEYPPEIQYLEPHEDVMLEDATQGTTPVICPYASVCGFQQYDDIVTGFHHHSFITYCSCPEGKTCVQTSEDTLQRTYIYTCKDVPELTTTPMDTTTTPMDGTPAMEDSTQTEQAGAGSPTFQSRLGHIADHPEL